ncbi:condensation domain-containing protein [Micromonospora sp. WMMD1082]|uniref:condensation domain-containing protein n=1 Tax=Micromonospora sp. WMMD1082 TaxID=3016104 RepID=UPI002417D900|nr:condensation domain-containing protein [Micromonospora sp. WMMD1082]MDG4797048.1 condensation domain-containing protein [Micromonospora sp. WMMD1082]
MADETTDLLRRLASLPANRRAAALRLLGRDSGAGSLRPRPDPSAPVRLSSGQEQVWLTDLMTGEPGSLVDHVAFRLTGPLDLAALQAAFGDLVARHEPLRSRLIRQGEMPMLVSGSAPVDVSVTELPAQGVAVATAAATSDLAVPFDLEQGPLARLRLYRLSPDDHVLVLASHHMVTDGVSQGVLLVDLEALYQARREGRPAALPPLTVHYGDFAEWQRGFLAGDRLTALTRYWTDRLADASARLALPLDRPRSARRGGAYLDAVAPAGLADRVTAAARQHATTPFVVLLTAFRLLLWRLTGARDTLVGTPISARPLAETENMVGYFLNMVVLRGAADPDASVRDLVAAEHASAMSAYAHQDLPFEQLVAQLRPPREIGSTPLVQTVFSVEGQPGMSGSYLGVDCEEIVLTGGWAQYDLMVKVVRDADLTARWDFDDAIMDVSRIAQWAQEFWALVDAVVDDPDRRVRDIPGLGDVPPAPAQADVEVLAWAGTAERVEPQGYLQETIAAAWQALLGVSPGAHDALFDLGGHSLTVAQLSFRLSEAFHAPVGVAELFGYQTVAAQAEYVEGLLLDRAARLSPDELARLLDGRS